MSLEELGGRSFQTVNEHLCSLRQHNRPHPRFGYKTAVRFAELTTACLRVVPALLAQYRHGRRAQVGGLRVDEPQSPSRLFIRDLRYRCWCRSFIDGGKR